MISVFSDLLFQPPSALLEMAHATSRVRLGAACWNPFTLHPYEIAGQWYLIDQASGGRAYLGLAKGSWLGAIGVEHGPSRRPHRAGGRAHRRPALRRRRGYEGDLFPLAPGTRLRYPLLRNAAPLLIGSWGPLGIALAGRFAEQLKVGGTANPDLAPIIRERLAADDDAVGRPRGDVRLVFGAVTVVDRDGAAARRAARREVAMYIDVIAELDPTVEVPADLLERIRERLAADDHEGAGALVTDDLLDRFAFSGTPEQVAAQAQALIDAGVDRVEFGTPHGLELEETGIALIGAEVVPMLNQERA